MLPRGQAGQITAKLIHGSFCRGRLHPVQDKAHRLRVEHGDRPLHAVSFSDQGRIHVASRIHESSYSLARIGQKAVRQACDAVRPHVLGQVRSRPSSINPGAVSV